MGVIDELGALSAAEDFFDYLELPYDSQVLNVARLHILRRMGQYLRREDFHDDDEAKVRARCREVLLAAYDDFVARTPIEERVFKVLQDAVASRASSPPKTLVSLSALDSMPQPVGSELEISSSNNTH